MLHAKGRTSVIHDFTNYNNIIQDGDFKLTYTQ